MWAEVVAEAHQICDEFSFLHLNEDVFVFLVSSLNDGTEVQPVESDASSIF